jgi:hypothetical protein
MLDYVKSFFGNDSAASLMRLISFLLVISGITFVFIAYFQGKINEAKELGIPMIAYGVGGKVGQKTIEIIPFILEKIFFRSQNAK